jgi:hypothetical protein
VSRHWSTALKKLGACAEAVEWAKGQPNYATAWATCERGDWMLWLLARLKHELTTAIAFWCADRAVRIHAPAALDAAGLHEEAAKLRALPPIVDEATARWGAASAASAASAACATSAASATWAAESKLQAEHVREVMPAAPALSAARTSDKETTQ